VREDTIYLKDVMEAISRGKVKNKNTLGLLWLLKALVILI
jgi:hypothetical protein